jgi:hypothetical protein
VWPIRVLEEDNDREYPNNNNIPRQPMELNTPPKPFSAFYPPLTINNVQTTFSSLYIIKKKKTQKLTPEMKGNVIVNHI